MIFYNNNKRLSTRYIPTLSTAVKPSLISSPTKKVSIVGLTQENKNFLKKLGFRLKKK